MSEIVIKHFGVKGMKWGHHKYAGDAQNRKYDQMSREMDRKSYGKTGVARINRRMNEGKSYRNAANREFARSIGKGVLAGLPVLAAALLEVHGKSPLTTIAKRAETKRGQAAAAAMRGIPFKASSGPVYAKAGRGGAYKIRSF